MELPTPLTLKPIGYIAAGAKEKFSAPHQPDHGKPASDDHDYIQLTAGCHYERALKDLSSFSHIWIIWWFHRNPNWRAEVLPPRGPAKRRGVFSTRSPHRPNPIGITAVELVKIDGLKIYIGNHDLIDETPVLDIKPYLKSADCFPDASIGWLNEVEKHLLSQPEYKIALQPLAETQLKWLNSAGQDFFERTCQLLKSDPSPHRTRRIIQVAENLYRISCAGWKIYYSINSDIISIHEFRVSFTHEKLHSEGFEHIINRDLYVDFMAAFPNQIS